MPPKSPSKPQALHGATSDVRDDGTFDKTYRRVQILPSMWGADECVLAVRREDYIPPPTTGPAHGAAAGSYSQASIVEVRVYSFDFETEDPDTENIMSEHEGSFGSACFNAVFPQHRIWRHIEREAKQVDVRLQQLLDMWVELPKVSPGSPKTPQQNSISVGSTSELALVLAGRQVAKVYVILEHFQFHLGDLVERKREMRLHEEGDSKAKAGLDTTSNEEYDDEREAPENRPDTRKQDQRPSNGLASHLSWSEGDVKTILRTGALFIKCAAAVNVSGDKLTNRTQNHLTCSILPTSFVFNEQDVTFAERRGESWIRRACISINTIPYVSSNHPKGVAAGGSASTGMPSSRRDSVQSPALLNPATVELLKQFHRSFMKDVALHHGLKASMFFLGAVAFRMMLRDDVHPTDVDTSSPAWRNFVALRCLPPAESSSYLPMEDPASCPYEPSLRSMVVQLLLKDESNRPSPQQVIDVSNPPKKRLSTLSRESSRATHRGTIGPLSPPPPEIPKPVSPAGKRVAPPPQPPLPLILSPRNAKQLAMTAQLHDSNAHRSEPDGSEAILETPFESIKRHSMRHALETRVGAIETADKASSQMNAESSAHKQFYGDDGGTSHGRRPLTESSKAPGTSSQKVRRTSPQSSRKSPRSVGGGAASTSKLKTAETAANDSRPSTPAANSPSRGCDRRQPKYEPVALEFAL